VEFAAIVLVLVVAGVTVAQQPAPQPGPMPGHHHMQGGMCPMMGSGMMGGGMMGGHKGSPIMFRMMFALMDDGDGQISLQEFQAAHERIFKAMDSNKDGQVTLEEMQSFMHGRPKTSASHQ
jgi:hypothetical protein